MLDDRGKRALKEFEETIRKARERLEETAGDILEQYEKDDKEIQSAIERLREMAEKGAKQ